MGGVMQKLAGSLIPAVGVAVGLCSATLEAETRPATIAVHVENHAEVPNSVLSKAERIASKIYAAAGVLTMWPETLIVSSDPSRMLHLTVMLLSREMGERMMRSSALGLDVLGVAIRSSNTAYILFHRLDEVASGRGLNGADLLGKIIAHEVGHLILPVNSHSLNGIMRANLNLTDAVQRFTREQSEMMRAVLQIDDRITGFPDVESLPSSPRTVLARR
jgi:hypothetical protein